MLSKLIDTNFTTYNKVIQLFDSDNFITPITYFYGKNFELPSGNKYRQNYLSEVLQYMLYISTERVTCHLVSIVAVRIASFRVNNITNISIFLVSFVLVHFIILK